jgi:hypothetical protein
MEETVTREEYFIDWLPRISEKLQFILLNIKEKREISEEDYDLLEVLHKNWFFGDFPLYRQELNLKEQNVTQPSLFTDGLAEKSQDVTVHPPTLVFGVDVADMLTQTKEKKK